MIAYSGENKMARMSNKQWKNSCLEDMASEIKQLEKDLKERYDIGFFTSKISPERHDHTRHRSPRRFLFIPHV